MRIPFLRLPESRRRSKRCFTKCPSHKQDDAVLDKSGP